MAISETKANKYRSAFSAVAKNDLRELMKIVTSMTNLKYNKKCPLEDSPFYKCGLIHAAACHGSPEIITFLLNKGNDVNLKGNMGKSPMHYVIDNRQKNVQETLQMFLRTEGVNISAKDSDGDTLLHYAACRDVKLVELLIKNKARVNLKNIWGETPLHIASEYGNTNIVKSLISHGSDIEARDNEGFTPLKHALFGCEPEKTVALLLKSGANPNDTDNKGNTTLHCAAMLGENKITALLVKAGADLSLCNTEGHTASDLARTPEMSSRLRPPKKRTKRLKDQEHAQGVERTERTEGKHNDNSIKRSRIRQHLPRCKQPF